MSQEITVIDGCIYRDGVIAAQCFGEDRDAMAHRIAELEADTEIVDFLQNLTVDTIYLDSGEIVDVRGGDLREAVRAVKDRPRCSKCRSLLELHQSEAGWCSSECAESAGGE